MIAGILNVLCTLLFCDPELAKWKEQDGLMGAWMDGWICVITQHEQQQWAFSNLPTQINIHLHGFETDANQ